MILKEAEEMARKGTKITRPAWNGDFFLYTDGKLLRGRYIGETCFTDLRAYAFSDEDRKACDWAAYSRTLPDDWEGCEILVPPAEQLRRWRKDYSPSVRMTAQPSCSPSLASRWCFFR